nr:putative reverse transcriptase domain-containing protein [Tanacetum cinerariifolium]
MSGYIVGISNPSNKESGTEITEGLVFNAELLVVFLKCLLLLSSVYRPKNRQERRSRNRKSLQQSSILKSLAMWGKVDDITTLVKSILDGSALGSFGQGGGDFLKEGATGNTNIKQCLRKVADGHFTAAVKVLSSSGVAPYSEIDSVFSCIKSFPKGTSCGRDGLTAQHILDALCGEGSATTMDLLKVITSIVNLWLARSCPPILEEFVASAPLTPLLKPDNRIRPIAAGTIWRCGVEAILHNVNRLLSECHNDGSIAMLVVDLLNAFNLVDRLALLHEIKDSCKLLLHAWYLDDGTVIGDSKEIAMVLDIIKRPSSGVKLLWGVVSRDTDFISGLAMRRATNVVDLMGLLPQLHDPIDGFTSKDTVPFKAQQTLTNVFFSEMVKDMEVYFDMNMRQKAVFECLCTPNAQDFLLAIPIDGLGQHISPVEYRTILKDVLFDICRRVGIFAKKEAPVNFLTHPSDGRSTLRPADVLVFGWVRGKHACVDLTGVSPLVGLSSRGFTAGQAALKAASGKVTKHEKACIENQHVFIPFAFDTFGFLALEAVELLSRVQRVMHNNVMTPRSTDVVFKRIGFAI